MEFHNFAQMAQNVPQGMRKGQYLINLLFQYRPDIYDKLPPELDVFYSDKMYSDAMSWICSSWNLT